MFNKKVTVLMPVYNGEKYISRAIDSLLNQTYKGDYDILIIDDGSTDNTVDIVKSYDSDKVHIIQNEQNMKVAATLNRGLDLITGKYIVRMDADDISHCDRLKIQIEFMDKHENIAVCGALCDSNEALFKLEDNNWRKNFGLESMFSYSPDMLRSILPFVFVLNHSTVVFRNEVLQKKKYRYSTEVGFIEDYDLWLRMIYCEDFFILPKRLLAYRRHDAVVSYADLSSRTEILKGLFLRFFKEYNVYCSYEELNRFCNIRAKIMHDVELEYDEKIDFFEFIKQKFYCNKKLARYLNPDYLRYALKMI